MNLKHLLKEARYYHLLGKGHLKRMFFNFLLSKTFFSKFVNTRVYNFFYSKRIEKFTKNLKPTILQIENTNFCNAKCIMCPHTAMKRKQEIMKLDDFEKIVDDVLSAYKSIKTVVITGFGEPLVDRGFIDKIKYINEKYPGIDIDFYTNGYLLTKELSEKILRMKLHKVNLSLNAMEKNYKKITGLDYRKIRENVLYFVKRKKELKTTYPLINFSLMILKENEKDVENFIELWSPYGDSVMVYLPLDWAGKKKIEAVETPFPHKKRWPCLPLWQSIMVDAHGDIIMCCQDYESRVKFGNALKKPIKEIWESPKFNKLRELHKKEIFSSDVCNTCDNWVNSSFWWWNYF